MFQLTLRGILRFSELARPQNLLEELRKYNLFLLETLAPWFRMKPGKLQLRRAILLLTEQTDFPQLPSSLRAYHYPLSFLVRNLTFQI